MRSELDSSIHEEAEQYIPFDISDVNLDYEILKVKEEGTGEEGRSGGRRQKGHISYGCYACCRKKGHY